MRSEPRIGILNFQYSDHNYGAVLQAAALEYVIRSLGADVCHIDFQVQPKYSIRSKISRALRAIGLIKSPAVVLNKEAFEVFRSQFIKRTSKVDTEEGFRSVSKGFDSVVVGSDQVWRPRMAKDPLAFFLAYVPETTNRVAYAASFGGYQWEASDNVELTKRVKQELERFKGVSVRESSGVKICREVFDIDAVHVLDPLLLVDNIFYQSVLNTNNNVAGSDVVYYKLDYDDAFLKSLDELGKYYNATPKNIYLKEGVSRNYQEVADWLSLIHRSKVVVTDSFHCICLALLFDKTIIYCPNEKRGQARMDSLFNMFEITPRRAEFLHDTSMYEISRPEKMTKILEEKRIESLRFLMATLEIECL